MLYSFLFSLLTMGLPPLKSIAELTLNLNNVRSWNIATQADICMKIGRNNFSIDNNGSYIDEAVALLR